MECALNKNGFDGTDRFPGKKQTKTDENRRNSRSTRGPYGSAVPFHAGVYVNFSSSSFRMGETDGRTGI